MTPSAGCSMVCMPISTPRTKLKCETKAQKHKPYDWAREGTIENLRMVNEFLIEKDMAGYLFGGCLTKRLPRKDIDVFVDYYLEDSEDKGYRTLGIDWWINNYERSFPPEGENVMGIVIRLPFLCKEYQRKESGGLYLPKEFIKNHPRCQLTKALYSDTEINKVEGSRE
ncbi:hypothetical protein CMI41_02065 [Candidatus Pacearchaeota archaeon]|jgi:hypothetical protein|nr:hypothetical protein [Candidatus Pacearchaeota archaeon]|tara:strand:+ start:4264 stop:4770 length:507 start_codon:yes stop_codon:yes gene_type:complete